MSEPKTLFITGATGWIGGSVLEGILKAFPELKVTALLRKPTSEFKERYPAINIVLGDFDSFEVIEKASSEADIVIHTGDIDHPGCAKAIISGCGKTPNPNFLIHLSGTGCITDAPEQTWQGEINPHVWNDITEIQEIYDLPPSAGHHVIDQNIMDASNDRLKTAIICPPDIYGQSTGIGNRTTYLVPLYIKKLLEVKEVFYLGAGENIRAVTYINDVVELFLLLIGEAIKGGGKAEWGREGFYFAVSDGIAWKDAAEAINKIGVDQGWLPKDSKPVSWSSKQLADHFSERPGLALYLWGSNSRAESARARRLGWNPHGPTFWEQLAEDVNVAVRSAT